MPSKSIIQPPQSSQHIWNAGYLQSRSHDDPAPLLVKLPTHSGSERFRVATTDSAVTSVSLESTHFNVSVTFLGAHLVTSILATAVHDKTRMPDCQLEEFRQTATRFKDRRTIRWRIRKYLITTSEQPHLCVPTRLDRSQNCRFGVRTRCRKPLLQEARINQWIVLFMISEYQFRKKNFGTVLFEAGE
jgi:hypothetical protein